MKNWGFEKIGRTFDAWPKDEAETPEAPAFLQHVNGSQLEVDMVKSLLEAYDIPVVCTYSNDGELGRVILGQPGSGTDLFVPASMLETAQALLRGGEDPDGDEPADTQGE